MTDVDRMPTESFTPLRDCADAERLVGLGFRYWLTGYRTGDISCWERAWCAYSSSLGPRCAKGAITDLSCWVRAISRHDRLLL